MNMIQSLVIEPEETSNKHLADWLAASTPSLEEVWDNEEDAVYDDL